LDFANFTFSVATYADEVEIFVVCIVYR